MWVLVLLALVMSVACTGRRGRTGGARYGTPATDTSGENYRPPASGSSASGKPSGATNYTCVQSEDCGYWFCRCEDGAVVNSGFCENGYCMDDYVACPDACSTFRHGDWTGTAGGGPGSDSSSGSDPRASDPSPSPGSTAAECYFGEDACSVCLGAECCAETRDCLEDADCSAYLECLGACTDSYCASDCEASYPTGAYLLSFAQDCANVYCSSDCG